MKVSVSVGGRFHAFDLASQLQRHGHLNRLITTYPKFKAREWAIPNDKITSIMSNEVLRRGWRRVSKALGLSFNLQYWFSERFDRLAAKYITGEEDIFVGWSSQSLHSMRKARERKVLTVLERGSTHILFQDKILKEEYQHCGLSPRLPHPKVIEKEMREYEEADCISIPSRFVKKTFVDHGVPENKLIHTPYGVNLIDFFPLEKNDNTFRVIHCGSLSLQKGVHYLIQAFHELSLKNAELWLIGPVQEEMTPYLKKYGDPRIHVKGTYPQNRLKELYSQGSVFCLASIQEGLAMVIAQAMACGLPVICTHNTGGEDLLRDGVEGYVIPAKDVQALKEKILFLYENPEKNRDMAQAALTRTNNEHSWDVYGMKLVGAYKNILQRRFE